MAIRLLSKWRRRAKQLKIEVFTLYFACKDTRTPWYAKIVALCVVGYALSPIDLIPDPIPIIGYLDDLIIIPLGIALAIRLIPRNVLDDCRARAQESMESAKRLAWIAAGVIVMLWIILILLVIWLVRTTLHL